VPRTKLTREQKKARTRSALVKAAAPLFAEQGFHVTSLEQVAERAGFTIGAVYSNFSGKEDLFLAVLDLWGLEEAIDLGGGLSRSRTSEAAIEAVDSWFRRRWTDPARLLAMAEFALHSRTRPEILDALRQRASVVHAGLDLVLQGLGDSIAIPDDVDPQLAVYAVLAISYGVAVQRIIEPQTPAADLVNLLVRRGLFGDGGDKKRRRSAPPKG
jgi:AcrR family transcriptional regulator